MAEYQKVEVGTTTDEPTPFSEEDIKYLEKEESEEQPPQQPEAVNEERPAWLPEKFGSGEELAKAYDQLQTEFTKDRQADPESTPETEAADAPTESLELVS